MLLSFSIGTMTSLPESFIRFNILHCTKMNKMREIIQWRQLLTSAWFHVTKYCYLHRQQILGPVLFRESMAS